MMMILMVVVTAAPAAATQQFFCVGLLRLLLLLARLFGCALRSNAALHAVLSSESCSLFLRQFSSLALFACWLTQSGWPLQQQLAQWQSFSGRLGAAHKRPGQDRTNQSPARPPPDLSVSVRWPEREREVEQARAAGGRRQRCH